MVGGLKRALAHLLYVLFLVLPVISPPFLWAQLPPPPEPETVMRVDVDLVVLPVSVTDNQYRGVSGLGAENFEVYEDGVRQEITRVQELDSPISVGLLFDASGSVTGNIELCRGAVRTFFGFAHPDDEYFLIEFATRPVLLVPFTTEIERILGHVGAARAGGRTAMYDAVFRALAQMEKARHKRKILLVLSDGQDNFSSTTEQDVANILMRMENSVQIYTLGVSPLRGFPLIQKQFGNQLPAELRMGPINLARLAEMSGGRSFILDGPDRLLDTVGKISRELRTQYEVVYHSSTSSGNSQWRTVRLEVKPPRGVARLEAHTRPGYFPASAPRSSLPGGRTPN
ncbi:MAG: VWA domain-containing protein [Terriglobia bacterium]